MYGISYEVSMYLILPKKAGLIHIIQEIKYVYEYSMNTKVFSKIYIVVNDNSRTNLKLSCEYCLIGQTGYFKWL